MSLILDMLMQEQRRIINMKEKYKIQLDMLPKGTLSLKKKEYYYLTYRKDNRVVTDYIGKYSVQVEKLKEKIERRKQIEKILKEIDKEYELIRKFGRLN